MPDKQTLIEYTDHLKELILQTCDYDPVLFVIQEGLLECIDTLILNQQELEQEELSEPVFN